MRKRKGTHKLEDFDTILFVIGKIFKCTYLTGNLYVKYIHFIAKIMKR